MPKTNYDSDSLEVLSGIEAVRRRPGMYTDTSTPNHAVMELVDNAVDEALSGHANHIDVIVTRSAVSVADNGRGIPIADHPEHHVPGAMLVFTHLHAGAKLGGTSYQRSGGLHGVGAVVANALSTRLEAIIHRDGRKMTMVFDNGEHSVTASSKTRPRYPSSTAVTMRPDPQFFDGPLNVKQLAESLRTKASLCPGLTVALTVATKSGRKKRAWTYDGGPSSMINRLVPDSPSNLRMDLSLDGTLSVHVSAIWQESGAGAKSRIQSYVNLVPTPLGGSHVSGTLSGMADAMNDYATKRKLKSAKIKITAKDVAHEACMILSVGLSNPVFAGQTKEKLTSREAMTGIKKVVAQQCLQWLLSGPKTGDATVKRILESAKRRSGTTARKSLVSGPLLPGKLVDCRSTELQESELFLVEGDSAGGSARQARDSAFQAVLPLKGKMANTWQMTPADVVKSELVGIIIAAIGVRPGTTDETPRYGKICILADADADGLHIAVLLCTLFVRHFESLVRRGFIYVALPPRYRLDVGGKTFYARDERDRDRKIRAIKKRTRKAIEILRFKGLGEMSSAQLRETAMHPETRHMIRLTMKNAKDTQSLMDMLMSRKRASDRRDWLFENGLKADA